MEKKSYESITFKVEKELSSPTKFLYQRNINDTFNSLFKRAKIKEESYFHSCGDNEIMEILNYDFNTNEKNFYNNGKNSLIQGLILSYKNHYPITISPDMIWILILQGYSRFMDKYSEKVRNKYVNFEGKKNISIKREGLVFEKATKEDWKNIIGEYIVKIKENIGEDLVNNLESNFTTTNDVTLITSQISIMSAVKKYFSFKVNSMECGISSITLEGSLEDWQKIKSKVEFLSKKEFQLTWWTEHLIPIIDKIILTKKYYDTNKEINEEIYAFWKDMIKIKDIRGFYKPTTIIDGWIIKLIPDLTKENPTIYNELNSANVPDQIISCPIELVFITKENIKKEYKCSLASGFYGMEQDKSTYNVKPVIGYAIVVEEKKTIN